MKAFILKSITALLILSTLLCGCGGGGSAVATDSGHSAGEGTNTTALTPADNSPQATTEGASVQEPQATTVSQCKHTFGNWMTTKEATCLETGEQVRICSKCSFAEMGEIKVLGHTTQAGVCERCQENIGADLAQSIQSIIQIHEVYPSKPNSAGGVDMNVAFSNTSNKTIKYIHFNVTPYNGVGDSVKCDIRDYYSFTGYVTGPLEPGYRGYSRVGKRTSAVHTWGEAWYNYDIKTLELNSVKIEYMDGSTYSLRGDELKLAFTDYPISQDITDLGSSTSISYSESNACFTFCLELNNDQWVGMAEPALVDIRFVNDDGFTVYSETHRIDEEDYSVKHANELNETVTATVVIPESAVTPGTNRFGTLYYHVYSPEGKFDFPEESERTYDLPDADILNDYTLYVPNISYYHDKMTLLASDGNLLTVEEVNNSFTEKTNGKVGVRVTVELTKILDTNGKSVAVSGRILNENRKTVKTFSETVWVYRTGDTSSIYVYADDLIPGFYTMEFDQVLMDQNGLQYHINDDLASYTAYLTEDTVPDLKVPATFASLPVTALYASYNADTALRSVTIPASVTEIDYAVFMNCPDLTSIKIDSRNPVYHSAGNCVIETASKTMIAGCGTSVIPADGSVETIAMAFYYCSSLRSITIPATVKEIRRDSFQFCTDLEQITLPNTAIVLGSRAFADCTSLKSITLPASLTVIPYGLFNNCTSLETVTVLGQLTEIEPDAFNGCTSLKGFVVPDTVTHIGWNAFTNTQCLTEENGILYNGKWAIDTARPIYDISLRDGTIGIAEEAFSQLYSLKSVYIPDSVKYLGMYAFQGCFDLKKVSLGAGIRELEYATFRDCTRLSTLTYRASKSAWEAIPKEEDWFDGAFTVSCTDGDIDISNIHAESSKIWWTTVGSASDKWNFSNPYIVGDSLFIDCHTVTFGTKVQWNDNGTGKLTGVASRSESFTLTAPVTGTYKKQTQAAGESGGLLLEVSLSDLYTDRPEKLYFRLSAYVNGKPTNVCIRFEITW